MNTRLVRSVYFDCLHRYENPEWSKERNAFEFGACYTPSGHGHSYKLEVCISGPIAKDTGMVINLKELDDVLKDVVATVDKKHLNFETAAFKSTIPTTENILQYLLEDLKAKMPGKVKLVRARLYENDDLWVEEYL